MADWSESANYGRGGYLPQMGGPSAFSRPYGGYSFEQQLPYQSGAASLPMSATPPYPVQQQTTKEYGSSGQDFYGPRYDPWKAYDGSWGAPGNEPMGPPGLARGMDSTRLSNLQDIYNTMKPQQAVQSPGYSEYGFEGFGGEGSPYNQPGEPQQPQAPQVAQQPQRNWAEEYKTYTDNTPATESGNPNRNSYYQSPGATSGGDRGGGFLSGPELDEISQLNRAHRAKQQMNPKHQQLQEMVGGGMNAARDTMGSVNSGMAQGMGGAANFLSQLLDFAGKDKDPNYARPYLWADPASQQGQPFGPEAFMPPAWQVNPKYRSTL